MRRMMELLVNLVTLPFRSTSILVAVQVEPERIEERIGNEGRNMEESIG